MQKQNNNKLNNQFTLRIYNQEDKELLEKCYGVCKDKFEKVADFIRCCVLTGADKMLGDFDGDQRLNLKEIKEYLISISQELQNIKGEIKQNHSEQKVDNTLIERLSNYIANLVVNLDCNKMEYSDNLKDGYFFLSTEKVDIAREQYGK